MNEQLFDYILMLNKEGYDVKFNLQHQLSNAIVITLRKSDFGHARIFDTDDFNSLDMEKDSIIIRALSMMKAEFEQGMRLKIK